MTKNRKYSDAQIVDAVESSLSVREVILSLGMSESGGSRQHLNRRIALLGLDTSHFRGQQRNRGIRPSNRMHWSQILVLRTAEQGKDNGARLKRCMMEAGVLYICATNGCPTRNASTFWEDITLEVDHVDGNNLNNRLENLRFLCPNCHSQAPTSSHSWKYATRYADDESRKCDCGNPKQRQSRRCIQCYHNERAKKPQVS